MSQWQIVEKDDFGTDWALVRYQSYALDRFDTEEAAIQKAEEYITDRNCNNALTKSEKFSGSEVFMMTKKGCFLGVLDGEPWYLYDRKKEPVSDTKYFELQGKTQVTVRNVPGT